MALKFRSAVSSAEKLSGPFMEFVYGRVFIQFQQLFTHLNLLQKQTLEKDAFSHRLWASPWALVYEKALRAVSGGKKEQKTNVNWTVNENSVLKERDSQKNLIQTSGRHLRRFMYANEYTCRKKNVKWLNRGLTFLNMRNNLFMWSSKKSADSLATLCSFFSCLFWSTACVLQENKPSDNPSTNNKSAKPAGAGKIIALWSHVGAVDTGFGWGGTW